MKVKIKPHQSEFALVAENDGSVVNSFNYKNKHYAFSHGRVLACFYDCRLVDLSQTPPAEYPSGAYPRQPNADGR